MDLGSTWSKAYLQSMLARGQRSNSDSVRCSTRYIPARAWSTSPLIPRRSACVVYPCLRGANEINGWQRASHPGISLLTRGQQTRARRRGTDYGYIPAYAGPTNYGMTVQNPSQVYPCLRGANPCGVIYSITKCPVYPCLRGANLDARHPVVHGRGISPLARSEF